jgi:transcriptional antiterminator RfaH
MSYWCVVRSELSREHVAAKFLIQAGYDIYFPRISERRINHGRKILVRRALFPNYLFARILMPEDIPEGIKNGHAIGWWQASRTCGVHALIMDGEGPARISETVIDGIKMREKDGIIQLPEPPPEFKPRDRVRIISGALTGHFGLFAGMKGSDRVYVLLSLLGGQSRTELARDAIERAVPS